MTERTTTFKGEIMKRISQSEYGTIFFINDFADLNNDVMVGKVLIEAEKLGKLIRLSNGIYFKPAYSRFGVVYPSTEKIVEAIAKRDKAQILPTGSTSMNLLGLSTQVPMNAVYITNGSPRVINVGKRKITLRKGVAKNFAFKGRIMPLLVQALRTMGKENITEHNVQTIRDILLKYPETETIQHDIQLAPLWIKKFLLPLITVNKENNNE